MKNLAGIFVIAFCLIACNTKDKEKETSSSLEVAEFAEMINDPSEKVILDVRTPEEFNEGHIRYAKLINFYDEDFKQQVAKLDKQVAVYVYCASGVRSDKAAALLREEGFREVYVLKNGFNDWAASNQEIFK